jgi:proline racemase
VADGGTCARMAMLHARGDMQVGDSMVHESIIGSRFTGRIAGTTTVAGKPAILPTIEGRAWITGLASEMLDPSDPYPTGYVLADTLGVSGTTAQ